MSFAENMKIHRRKQALSLRTLAALSNVSKTMLSEIETGKKTPTLTVACRIAAALGLGLSALISGQGPSQPLSIIRKNERNSFEDPATSITRQWVSPPSNSMDVEIMVVKMPAGTTTGLIATNKSGDKQYLVVTKGTVRVMIGPGNDCVLAEGDSMYFEARSDYAIANEGPGAAEYFFVLRRILP